MSKPHFPIITQRNETRISNSNFPQIGQLTISGYPSLIFQTSASWISKPNLPTIGHCTRMSTPTIPESSSSTLQAHLRLPLQKSASSAVPVYLSLTFNLATVPESLSLTVQNQPAQPYHDHYISQFFKHQPAQSGYLYKPNIPKLSQPNGTSVSKFNFP